MRGIGGCDAKSSFGRANCAGGIHRHCAREQIPIASHHDRGAVFRRRTLGRDDADSGRTDAANAWRNHPDRECDGGGGLARGGARSTPDGYPIGFGHLGTHVANGAIYKLGYDLVTDLEPVVLLPSNPMIIVSKIQSAANGRPYSRHWLKAMPTPASA